jgi:hypothetical protein
MFAWVWVHAITEQRIRVRVTVKAWVCAHAVTEVKPRCVAKATNVAGYSSERILYFHQQKQKKKKTSKLEKTTGVCSARINKVHRIRKNDPSGLCGSRSSLRRELTGDGGLDILHLGYKT